VGDPEALPKYVWCHHTARWSSGGRAGGEVLGAPGPQVPSTSGLSSTARRRRHRGKPEQIKIQKTYSREEVVHDA